MISKKEKFSSKDFSNKKLFKNSKKIYTPYGFFLVLEDFLCKKGIILLNKNFKTAVLRNKYKRLFYNTLLELKKDSKIDLQKKSFVFYPKKQFSKEELIKDILEIFML